MKRLLKITAMSGLLTLFKMAMGFIVAKVVAIYTGPTGMAMLGQVQSMAGILNGVINAPVGNGVVRFTAENKNKGFEICSPWWRASLQWVLIVSIIIVPSGLFLSDTIAFFLFQNKRLAWIVIATLSVLPFSALGTLCNSVINGQQLYRRYILLGMLSVFISGSIMILMIIYYGINGALLAAAIQSALIGIIMLIINLRQPWFKFRYLIGKTDSDTRKAIGGYMLMALTSALSGQIALILVRSLLIKHLGWDATGQWQAVWKISEVYLGVITIALGTYYLPKLSSISGYEKIISEINTTAKVIIPIVSLMALFIYISRDFLISFLFTSEFSGASNLFLIQLIGDVIKMVSWLYAYPMLSIGATKWFVFSELTFSMLFVFLAYLFMNIFGLKGVPIAYLINYIIYFIFILLNLKRIVS